MKYDKRFVEVWRGMNKRCDPRYSTRYTRYAGRGIKVMWSSFEAFASDMYSSYLAHVEKYGEKDTTIERIDTSADYSSNNCKWATWREQFNNRTTTSKLTLHGKTMSITEWAKSLGVKRSLISTRINRDKWTVEEALTTGVFKCGEALAKPFTVISPDGVEHTGNNLSAFCREHGLIREAFANIQAGKAHTHKGWRMKKL